MTQVIAPDKRLAFANKHGIDKFLFVRECFSKAPLQSRRVFWNQLTEVIFEQTYTRRSEFGFNVELPVFRAVLDEYASICDVPYVEEQSIALLPPNFRYCPLKCRKQNEDPYSLTCVQHKPTRATVYEVSGSSRSVSVLHLRCQKCQSVLEYDTIHVYGTGYQFYQNVQPYIRITNHCYFSRRLCEHIVRCLASGRHTFDSFAAIWKETYRLDNYDRKWVSIALYRHEVEVEVRCRPGWLEVVFKCQNGYDEILLHLEACHAKEGFCHIETSRCSEYSCKYFYILDGFWSIWFLHCAANVKNQIQGFPGLKLPDHCPRQPVHNSLYCMVHESSAEADAADTLSVGYAQTSFAIPAFAELLNATTDGATICDGELVSEPECRKNLGELRCAEAGNESEPQSCPKSRGYLMIVRPCGQICAQSPIYKSESPTQVFLIALSFLYTEMKRQQMPPGEWKKVFLVYDNMCNLDRLKAARNPLPLPQPYDRLWLGVSKVIDKFHISNHTRPECHTTYHPRNIMVEHPDLRKKNTSAAEQTFSWFRRLEPSLNCIPRNRQIFVINRLIERRNSYLATLVYIPEAEYSLD